MIGLLVSLACGPAEDTGTDYHPPGSGEIGLDTTDGVHLVADSYPASAAARPGIVLLHMNPVAFDRTDWPASFLEILHERDWNVIVPDRRGAGESDGDAETAANTEAGMYDVEASVRYLRTEASAGEVVLLGASNGTTSAVDYVAHAEDEGWTSPIALGFMTGGAYTEHNNPVTVVGDLPAIFTYSTAERDWSVGQQGIADDVREFHEYPAGDHGTKMFAAAPEVADDLVSWVSTVVGP